MSTEGEEAEATKAAAEAEAAVASYYHSRNSKLPLAELAK